MPCAIAYPSKRVGAQRFRLRSSAAGGSSDNWHQVGPSWLQLVLCWLMLASFGPEYDSSNPSRYRNGTSKQRSACWFRWPCRRSSKIQKQLALSWPKLAATAANLERQSERETERERERESIDTRRYLLAGAQSLAGSLQYSMCEPDAAKVGTDLSVLSGAIMNSETGEVRMAIPQVIWPWFIR